MSLKRGLSFCTTDTGLYCIICTNSNFSGHFHFLQIQLDGSNYHIFPPYFAQMKWKIDGSSAHKRDRTLQFFTFFPAIYSTYNGSARKKSSRIFSCVRVRITTSSFSPGKYVHIYNRGDDVQTNRTGVAARISCGYILPRADVNSSQIGSDGAPRLWWNLRSSLVCRISYRQVISRQPHIILRWKNV